jgi:hypothetical protein
VIFPSTTIELSVGMVTFGAERTGVKGSLKQLAVCLERRRRMHLPFLDRNS